MYFLKELLLIGLFAKLTICSGGGDKVDIKEKITALSKDATEITNVIFGDGIKDDAKKTTEEKITAFQKKVGELPDQLKKALGDDSTKAAAKDYENNVKFITKVFGSGGSAGGWFSLKNMMIYSLVFVVGAIAGGLIGYVVSKKN